METIQIILLAFATFALTRVLKNIKKRTIERLEGIFWTLFWVLVMIAAIIPEITANIAKLFGVGRGVDLAVYLGIITLSYLLFRLYIQVTRIEKDITKIIRTISLKNENKS